MGASAGSDAYRRWWEVGATSFDCNSGHPCGDQTCCVRHYVDDNGDPHIEQLKYEYEEMFVEEYNKKWEGSYTEGVVQGLDWIRTFQMRGLPYYRNLTDAMDLLKQYHKDLHVPYDQRDVARREVLELRKEVLRLRKNLAAMVVVPLIDDLKMARGAAAACNLYGAVRAIDRAIEAL